MEGIYEPLLTAFRGHFRDAYQRIVIDAPITVQDDCASECAQGKYRRCLEKSLLWMQEAYAPGGCYLFLPENMLDLLIKDVVTKVSADPLFSKSSNREAKVPLLALGNKRVLFSTITNEIGRAHV